MTDMDKSFDSWDSLNEKRNIARGGKKLSFKYKVRTGGNVFIFASKGMPNVIDTNNEITKKGFESIRGLLNKEDDFTKSFGKLDDAFFSENILVYVVNRNRKNSFSIQFDKISRKEGENLKKIEFDKDIISQKGLKALIQANSGIKLSSTIKDAAVKPSETIGEEELASEEEAKGTPVGKSLKGKSFKYTMRTNGVTYTFTFNDKGALQAVTEDSNYVNGTISIETPKIMWYTDSSIFRVSDENSKGLLINSEITNSKDKSFFTKMLTDEKFRKKYLEGEEESISQSGVFDNETIKSVLYNRDETFIFAGYSAAKVGSKDTETVKAGPDLYGVATQAARKSKARQENKS